MKQLNTFKDYLLSIAGLMTLNAVLAGMLWIAATVFPAVMFAEAALAQGIEPSCAAFQFFFARGTNERLIPRPGTDDKVTFGLGEVGLSTWDLYTENGRAPPRGAAALPVNHTDFIVEMNNPVELLKAIREIWDQATDPAGQGCVDACPAVWALRKQLFQAAFNCPESKFVLVGYSFGAMVIQRYMHLVPTDLDADLTIGRNKVVGVLLYGDPTWPQLPELAPRLGIATSFDFGFRRKEDYIPTVPSGINERFMSLCLSYDLTTVVEPYTAYDPICLHNPFDPSPISGQNNFFNCFAPEILRPPENQCPHRQYHELGGTKQGADFLATITGANSCPGPGCAR